MPAPRRSVLVSDGLARRCQALWRLSSRGVEERQQVFFVAGRADFIDFPAGVEHGLAVLGLNRFLSGMGKLVQLLGELEPVAVIVALNDPHIAGQPEQISGEDQLSRSVLGSRPLLFERDTPYIVGLTGNVRNGFRSNGL